MEAEMQKNLGEFEKNRVALINTSNQKQQLQMQSNALQKAIDELDKTKEPKAFKAVGPIMVLSEVPKLKEELSNQKESVDLRAKTLQKQEDFFVEKLNKLKSEIESKSSQQGQQAGGKKEEGWEKKPKKVS